MMEQKYNPLLCVTTYNKLGMTKKTAEWFMDLGYDLFYIDDCSVDGTQDYLAQIKVECLLKDQRQGLTHSWNWAYKYWKMSKQYSHIVICNNDVLVPKGCIENLMSEYELTVPMCNENGAGYACKEQGFGEFAESILQSLQDLAIKDYTLAKCWTGFMMCMSREIEQYELTGGNLFNPENVNVGNDDDLAKRVPAFIALGSFVYHYKGVSFDGKIAGRNDIS